MSKNSGRKMGRLEVENEMLKKETRDLGDKLELLIGKVEDMKKRYCNASEERGNEYGGQRNWKKAWERE